MSSVLLSCRGLSSAGNALGVPTLPNKDTYTIWAAMSSAECIMCRLALGWCVYKQGLVTTHSNKRARVAWWLYRGVILSHF